MLSYYYIIYVNTINIYYIVLYTGLDAERGIRLQQTEILGRSRRDRIRNEVTRKELGQQVTLVDKIRKRRLTWFGHITRMEGNRLPVVALYGQVEGTRS